MRPRPLAADWLRIAELFLSLNPKRITQTEDIPKRGRRTPTSELEVESELITIRLSELNCQMMNDVTYN